MSWRCCIPRAMTFWWFTKKNSLSQRAWLASRRALPLSRAHPPFGKPQQDRVIYKNRFIPSTHHPPSDSDSESLDSSCSAGLGASVYCTQRRLKTLLLKSLFCTLSRLPSLLLFTGVCTVDCSQSLARIDARVNWSVAVQYHFIFALKVKTSSYHTLQPLTSPNPWVMSNPCAPSHALFLSHALSLPSSLPPILALPLSHGLLTLENDENICAWSAAACVRVPGEVGRGWGAECKGRAAGSLALLTLLTKGIVCRLPVGPASKLPTAWARTYQ